MAVTPEAISLPLLLRSTWLITMPKRLFVPYDKRPQHGFVAGMEGEGGTDDAPMTGLARKSTV
jgi:hypothetical protein